MSYGSGRGYEVHGYGYVVLTRKERHFCYVGVISNVFYIFLLKILLTIKVETMQCDYNRTVTYLDGRNIKKT